MYLFARRGVVIMLRRFFVLPLHRMAKIDFKIEGIKELQRRLADMKQVVDKRVETELRQLGEEAVTYSKENKGYRDHTANLKNSISYALFKDGKLLESKVGIIPKPEEDANGQAQVEDNLMKFASKDGVVSPTGYTLIVVAGMNYGKYVEDKGYNVLYLTERYLRKGIEGIIKSVMEDMFSK